MYGPAELCYEIGEFFQSYDMFIQDPSNCNRLVRYCNPHRLSSADPNNCQWTWDLIPGDLTWETKDVSAGPDILDLLDSQVDLAETPQPLVIETVLKRYQIPSRHSLPLVVSQAKVLFGQTSETGLDLYAPAGERLEVR